MLLHLVIVAGELDCRWFLSELSVGWMAHSGDALVRIEGTCAVTQSFNVCHGWNGLGLDGASISGDCFPVCFHGFFCYCRRERFFCVWTPFSSGDRRKPKFL